MTYTGEQWKKVANRKPFIALFLSIVLPQAFVWFVWKNILRLKNSIYHPFILSQKSFCIFHLLSQLDVCVCSELLFLVATQFCSFAKFSVVYVLLAQRFLKISTTAIVVTAWSGHKWKGFNYVTRERRIALCKTKVILPCSICTVAERRDWRTTGRS